MCRWFFRRSFIIVSSSDSYCTVYSSYNQCHHFHDSTVCERTLKIVLFSDCRTHTSWARKEYTQKISHTTRVFIMTRANQGKKSTVFLLKNASICTPPPFLHTFRLPFFTIFSFPFYFCTSISYHYSSLPKRQVEIHWYGLESCSRAMHKTI